MLPEGAVVAGRRVGEYVRLQPTPVESCSGDSDDGLLSGSSPGGWLPVCARGEVGLEECRGPASARGRWWYRVVHPRGAQFLSRPRLDAPRHEKVGV